MTAEPIKLLVASPDHTLAGALAAAVSSDPAFEIVGHTAKEEELDDLVSHWQPTLVLLSLALPESLELVAKLDGRATVLTLDTTEDPDRMLDAFGAGASGYVTVEAGLGKLVEAVVAVASGVVSVPPTLLGHLLRQVVQRRRAEREALEMLDSLTPREREVFELAARGHSHSEVAESLFISAATARTHLGRVFSKLDVHSRAELVALAARCGLEIGTIEQEQS